MRITEEKLIELGVKPIYAERYSDDLGKLCAHYDINTPLRSAHFLAQVLHESTLMSRVEENLNYSAAGLLKTFKKYFTPAEAEEYARNPRRIASCVYGNRYGNGDEASEDGYRYRGRGLIQLTFRDNYRSFGRWLNNNAVVNKPDLVAEVYPVHSAVYYWTTRNLNSKADLDDVVGITRAINSGTNGLADRKRYLAIAKLAFSIEQPAPPTINPTHVVDTEGNSGLRFRSKPFVANSTYLATLHEAQEVEKLLEIGGDLNWWSVKTVLNGRAVEGYVSANYLRPISQSEVIDFQSPQPTSAPIPSIHLSEGNRSVTRARDGGRAHALGEASMPRRRASNAISKARELIKIVNYLASANPDHERYAPKTRTTYCNIWAYDYCYLANAYLPRVWWTEKSLIQIARGETVPVQYGKTVRELNANNLHDWLADYGPDFGWKRVLDSHELQNAANMGEVCLIIAKRANINESGHIAAVVPEHDGHEAQRDVTGRVTRPLESQAGRYNYRFVTKSSRWWLASRYQSFGLWSHA